jgi:hypothetical protein
MPVNQTSHQDGLPSGEGRQLVRRYLSESLGDLSRSAMGIDCIHTIVPIVCRRDALLAILKGLVKFTLAQYERHFQNSVVIPARSRALTTARSKDSYDAAGSVTSEIAIN